MILSGNITRRQPLTNGTANDVHYLTHVRKILTYIYQLTSYSLSIYPSQGTQDCTQASLHLSWGYGNSPVTICTHHWDNSTVSNSLHIHSSFIHTVELGQGVGTQDCAWPLCTHHWGNSPVSNSLHIHSPFIHPVELGQGEGTQDCAQASVRLSLLKFICYFLTKGNIKGTHLL